MSKLLINIVAAVVFFLAGMGLSWYLCQSKPEPLPQKPQIIERDRPLSPRDTSDSTDPIVEIRYIRERVVEACIPVPEDLAPTRPSVPDETIDPRGPVSGTSPDLPDIPQNPAVYDFDLLPDNGVNMTRTYAEITSFNPNTESWRQRRYPVPTEKFAFRLSGSAYGQHILGTETVTPLIGIKSSLKIGSVKAEGSIHTGDVYRARVSYDNSYDPYAEYLRLPTGEDLIRVGASFPILNLSR